MLKHSSRKGKEIMALFMIALTTHTLQYKDFIPGCEEEEPNLVDPWSPSSKLIFRNLKHEQFIILINIYYKSKTLS